ncbi:unnamed protein product [uncultured bacterium]|nr:unnamed protein product [uncultured bacterium]
MTETDRLLFASLTAPPYTRDRWDLIAGHVLNRLGQWLGHPVEANEIQVGPPESAPRFHGRIASAASVGGPLAFSWFGFIHTASYAATPTIPEKAFVAAWLFCRSQGRRVLTRDGLAYIYLTYEQLSSDEAGWIDHGWQRDEFGEFEDW